MCMADHKTALLEERKGSVLMRGRRVVHFSIQHYHRHRKQLRWLVRFEETGKRYTGSRVLPEWFRNEEAALDAVRAKWRAIRGGFTYPKRR